MGEAISHVVVCSHPDTRVLIDAAAKQRELISPASIRGSIYSPKDPHCMSCGKKCDTGSNSEATLPVHVIGNDFMYCPSPVGGASFPTIHPMGALCPGCKGVF